MSTIERTLPEVQTRLSEEQDPRHVVAPEVSNPPVSPESASWPKFVWAALAVTALGISFAWLGTSELIHISGERESTPSQDEFASMRVNTPVGWQLDQFASADGVNEAAAAAIALDPTTIQAFGRAEIDYEKLMAENLAIIKAASVRNRNHDQSPYRDTPMGELVLENHFGPRSEYLGRPAGNPENSFPVGRGGQFRAACEFSHFAYDDPLVYPNMPGASHLHMFFGNTDTNAYTTYDSLSNSGSSTCNGQELNRTGYWVPAMFDGGGDVRIPERIVIYYKGEGKARGNSEVYPAGAAMIAEENLNTKPVSEGGAGGNKLTFLCTDNFSTRTATGSNTVPSCQGSRFGTAPDRAKWVVMEMNIKFPQCWNGQNPADIANFRPPQGDWYVSRCGSEFNHTLPNLEYFVNYRVEMGEDTSSWFIASDVNPVSFDLGDEPAGATVHGDWWGGWHPEVNRLWIDNCVNYSNPSAKSGCGRGYLTDGGPNNNAPYDGPALKIRPQYEGPTKVAASTLFAELCPNSDRAVTTAADAAYCTPGSDAGHSHGDTG